MCRCSKFKSYNKADSKVNYHLMARDHDVFALGLKKHNGKKKPGEIMGEYALKMKIHIYI